jgi:hypothetical protein
MQVRIEYKINIFNDFFFLFLCKFSLLPEHTKKRRAFGIVFVGTTNGKVN